MSSFFLNERIFSPPRGELEHSTIVGISNENVWNEVFWILDFQYLIRFLIRLRFSGLKSKFRLHEKIVFGRSFQNSDPTSILVSKFKFLSWNGQRDSNWSPVKSLIRFSKSMIRKISFSILCSVKERKINFSIFKSINWISGP